MSYLIGRYITEDGLKHIKNHKYQPGAYSLADNILNPFWCTVVEFLPKTMAPNTVTLLGLAALGGSYATMLWYDTSMTQYLPTWTYLAVALGIFIFQTLDAIDGKQARRTGSSSSLGQLFDHGCDAISWTITNLSVVSFLQLGLTPNAILAMVASCGPFYLTNLLEYYSGVYEYAVAGTIDGTSGQILLIVFNLLPFFYGGNVYDRPVREILWFLPDFLTRDFICKQWAMVLIIYVGVIYCGILAYYTIVAAKGPKAKITCTLQMLQHFGCYWLMYMFDESIPFVRDNAGLVYISILFLYSLITTKLIVCIMGKMTYSFIHLEYLVFCIYFYFQYQYHNDKSEENERNLKYAFYLVFGIMGFLYFRFVQGGINQIASYLGIYCFSIKSPKEKES